VRGVCHLLQHHVSMSHVQPIGDATNIAATGAWYVKDRPRTAGPSRPTANCIPRRIIFVLARHRYWQLAHARRIRTHFCSARRSTQRSDRIVPRAQPIYLRLRLCLRRIVPWWMAQLPSLSRPAPQVTVSDKPAMQHDGTGSLRVYSELLYHRSSPVQFHGSMRPVGCLIRSSLCKLTHENGSCLGY
jgi:hypothetical protein